MAKPPFIVVNPMAANKRVAQKWPDLRREIQGELGIFDFAFTEGPVHAEDLTRMALKDGYRNIGSLGGDGTHSLVLNGFFEDGRPVASDATLSVLPAGTGGDFRRNLDIEGGGLAAFARAMARSDYAIIDVGHIRFVGHDGADAHRYFLNIASFGMGGHVDELVNRTTKVLGGKASFLIATVRAMATYDAPRVRISIDDEALEPTRLFVGAACNGQYFGGGMWIGPQAKLRDGLLDLIVMPWQSRLYHLLRGTAVYKGEHVDQPGVISRRGRVIRAESESTCLLDIDGEAPGRLPAEIRILPAALRLKGLSRKTTSD